MLVTGAPPNFGGGGMPQRIIISSRTAPAPRIPSYAFSYAQPQVA
jgi:hypothetical protein